MCVNSRPRWQVASALTLAGMLASSLSPLMSEPSHPAWWSGGVKNNNPVQNKGVANIGQLKNVANLAHAELEALLPGGAGFSQPFTIPTNPGPDAAWYLNQKKALNLGQLKAVAKPFYDRLNEIDPLWVKEQMELNELTVTGSPPYYPWNPATPVSENYKPANVGQLKLVFALRFRTDSDSDGVSDIIERMYRFNSGDGTDAKGGTSGADSLTGGAGRTLISGKGGNDSLTGLTDHDVLLGGDGDDTLSGYKGNDTLYGGRGNDLLYGENDDDIYVWNWGDGKDFSLDALGMNTLRFGRGILSSHVTLQRGSGDSGSHLTNWNDDPLGNDLKVIINHPTDSSLDGYFIIDSWASNKIVWQIVFEDDPSPMWDGELTGTLGNDTINGRVVDDVISGKGGDDTLIGNEGNDILSGDEGDDKLFGKAGDDTLIGGAGDDELRGESGSDTFKWNWGDGGDYAVDTSSAELRFGPGILPGHITIERDSVSAGDYNTNWAHDPTGPDVKLIVTHPTDSNLSGFVVLDNMNTTWTVTFESDRHTIWDHITGDTNNNGVVNATAGSDYMHGATGNDTYDTGTLDAPDHIREQPEQAYPNDTDLDMVWFGTGILPSELTLQKDGNDLVILRNKNGDYSWVRVYDHFHPSVARKIEMIAFKAIDPQTSVPYVSIFSSQIEATTQKWDTDSDGMPDWWETKHSLNPNSDDSATDTDSDGLNALAEYQHNTNPTQKDTDGDGVSDGVEVNQTNTLPTEISAVGYQDSDGDGLINADELAEGSDMFDPDSNDDGVLDGETVRLGLDPTSWDPDGDGLNTAQENALGTSPVMADTDGDGVDDDVDAAPLDPDITTLGGSSGDTTGPVINLILPTGAVPQ